MVQVLFKLKSLMLGAVISLAALASAAADDLVSYQAVYEIKLQSASAAADVKTINGQTHFILEDVCDGWRSVEDYALSFGFGDDGVSNFISHYETWEANDASAFSFSVLENSNIEGEQKYDGFANASNGVAESFHTLDGGVTTELPSSTMFPTAHMKLLLKKAKEGKRLHQSHIFLGGDLSSSLYLVNAVLGKERETEELDVLGAVGMENYWPVTIAYFKPDAVSSEPTYEISFRIQNNGVIQSYAVDYGDFVMRADMSAASKLTPTAC